MNKVNFIGRIVKDFELKTVGKDMKNTTFTIAVDRTYKKDGQPDADFFNIVAWGKTAEFISKWFAKGVRIGVSGRIQNKNWEDKEGKKHYATEIIAEEVYFADGKKDVGTNFDAPPSAAEVDDDTLPF